MRLGRERPRKTAASTFAPSAARRFNEAGARTPQKGGGERAVAAAGYLLQ